MLDVLVVGAGFAGSVVARQLAESGRRVLVIDKRSHVGGNAYDEFDKHGVLIHPYGPHIFHTNAKRIFEYLSKFTDWRFYEHRVLAKIGEQLLPIPINRTTINKLYGLNLDETGVGLWLEGVRECRVSIRTSEDVVLSTVGRDLCEKFFRGYTKKQWGLDLSQLSASVAARVPVRTNDDDRYFGDSFQFIPADGYTRMFERMLAHQNIQVRLNSNYLELRDELTADHIVYTGPIDAFFGYCYGALPYRSLHFEHQHLAGMPQYQAVGTINFPNDYPYTRVTEFKHITGQEHSGTSIVREIPQDVGEPYYPVPRPENEAIFKQYEELARQRNNVTFVGRLAQYRYYNMDQVVAAALKAAQRVVAGLRDG